MKMKVSLPLFKTILSKLRKHSKHANASVDNVFLVCIYLINYFSILVNKRRDSKSYIRIKLDVLACKIFSDVCYQTALSRLKTALKVLEEDGLIQIFDEKNAYDFAFKPSDDLYQAFVKQKKGWALIEEKIIFSYNLLDQETKITIIESEQKNVGTFVRPQDKFFALLLIVFGRDEFVKDNDYSFVANFDNMKEFFLYEGKNSASKVICKLKKRAKEIFKTLKEFNGKIMLGDTLQVIVRDIGKAAKAAYQQTTVKNSFEKTTVTENGFKCHKQTTDFKPAAPSPRAF